MGPLAQNPSQSVSSLAEACLELKSQHRSPGTNSLHDTTTP
jgi:hypothetical protein